MTHPTSAGDAATVTDWPTILQVDAMAACLHDAGIVPGAATWATMLAIEGDKAAQYRSKWYDRARSALALRLASAAPLPGTCNCDDKA